MRSRRRRNSGDSLPKSRSALRSSSTRPALARRPDRNPAHPPTRRRYGGGGDAAHHVAYETLPAGTGLSDRTRSCHLLGLPVAVTAGISRGVLQSACRNLRSEGGRPVPCSAESSERASKTAQQGGAVSVGRPGTSPNAPWDTASLRPIARAPALPGDSRRALDRCGRNRAPDSGGKCCRARNLPKFRSFSTSQHITRPRGVKQRGAWSRWRRRGSTAESTRVGSAIAGLVLPARLGARPGIAPAAGRPARARVVDLPPLDAKLQASCRFFDAVASVRRPSRRAGTRTGARTTRNPRKPGFRVLAILRSGSRAAERHRSPELRRAARSGTRRRTGRGDLDLRERHLRDVSEQVGDARARDVAAARIREQAQLLVRGRLAGVSSSSTASLRRRSVGPRTRAHLAATEQELQRSAGQKPSPTGIRCTSPKPGS